MNMRIGKIYVLILSLLIILTGCNSVSKDASNTLKITENDEKTILEYLNINTKDIANSSKGKIFNAFKILGTDKDRIYIWLVKKEYFKKEDQNTLEDGSVVSLPVVLYIKKVDDGISVTKHKCPPDGVNYGKVVTKLFPSNIRKEFPDKDVTDKLVESTLVQAKRDFNIE